MAFCNLDKAFYPIENHYGFPQVKRYFGNTEVKRWVAFNLTRSCKMNLYRKDLGIHFFIDDYQFETLWENPNKYIDNFKKVGLLVAPDFSLYSDFPYAIQMYNKYRNHWLTRFYQDRGIDVIPSLLWSDEESLNWAFDGYEKGGIYCLPRIGVTQDEESDSNFKQGLYETVRKLDPFKILVFQKNSHELGFDVGCDVEIVDTGFNHTLDTRAEIRENGIDNIYNSDEDKE